MNHDLRHLTYEELIDFVFDHVPEDEVNDKWYWQGDVDVQIEPRQAVAFLARVCTSAAELSEAFTLLQIAEGVTYLFGAGAGREFGEQLWNPDVPWPERQACIRAIPSLYTQVFERDIPRHCAVPFTVSGTSSTATATG